MAVYNMVEPYNQQPQPGDDIALTPRIETFMGEDWYTNLFDLPATTESKDTNGVITIGSVVSLKNQRREMVADTASEFQLTYKCSLDKLEIKVKANEEIRQPTAFVLPIISANNEELRQVSQSKYTIKKPEGVVAIDANRPIKIKDISGDRVFNMVPGVEAIPFEIYFGIGVDEITLSIRVFET